MKQLESSIERSCKREADKAGAIFLKITQHKGWPDRILWADRAVIPVFVELKRPGERPTKLQLYIHNMLREKGLTVLVIDSVEKFKGLL